MTRTNKWTTHEQKAEPKWFTKHGHYNEDPTKIKKDGAGRHNWGKPDESDKDMLYNYLGRRNSNHELMLEKMDLVEKEVDKTLSQN
jgi:hypothetical protein